MFKRALHIFLYCLFLSGAMRGQLVTNGSITGAPCANSGVSSGNAAGWSGCGFSPDLCCVAMPSYLTTSQVTPVASPDGGTWLGIAALGECAQTTITGLVTGTTYTLYFCGACFGTGALFNATPATPRITVGASVITFNIPMAASTWNKYSMTFVATAATMTLKCEHLNGSNSYASLDGFSLLPTSPCGPTALPVEMMSFEANYNSKDKVVDINWKTATETNVDYFSVEKSSDAASYEEIEHVKTSNGDSYMVKNYSAIDKRPFPEQSNYYRIVTVDKDGSRQASQIREVSFMDNDASLLLSPNPAKNELELSFSSEEGTNWKLNFINAHGFVIETKELSAVTTGVNKILLDISGYNAGLYFVNISDGKNMYKRKFVKE